MDQIANQGAKNRYMFGGKTIVPMVIRTPGGAGLQFAAQHSQSLEALWTHFPGLYVVMPSTPYDAKGLLKTAIRDNNPVMFIEHKLLYNNEGPVPTDEYLIPFGVADVKRQGKDLTILTYSRMVNVALQAAEQLAAKGIDVEVVDLRSLRPLDRGAIAKSVKKTGRVIALSEGYPTNGFATELITVVIEEAFDWLDVPPLRLDLSRCSDPHEQNPRIRGHSRCRNRGPGGFSACHNLIKRSSNGTRKTTIPAGNVQSPTAGGSGCQQRG